MTKPEHVISTPCHFSPCGQFRYTLTRLWKNDFGHTRLLVVMLNPSTANDDVNDPTVARCVQRAYTEGYSILKVANLYAYRSPYPEVLTRRWREGRDIIGPDNDKTISVLATEHCQAALVAWGNHPLAAKRDQKVLGLLYDANLPVYCLGLTKGGFPRHPLHVAYAHRFELYKGRFAQ